MVKYQKISNEIRKRIADGYYSSDQPIPDEITLAKEFGCSRMTMKRALDILVSEGVLFRKRGHGTFIIKSCMQNTINVVDRETLGLSNLLKGKDVTSKVIKFEVKFPSEEVAEQLSIDRTTPVYEVIRLRIVDKEPYVIEQTYMPTTLLPGINETVLHSSVYKYITETLGLTIAGSHRKIRASKPTQLDQEYLECAPDDPVLEVEAVGFLNNGSPFEYSFSRHRYDKFVFTTVNIRR
ncbi:GntR family transcriptional regulator [Mesobacillus foraminis]|uniref:GntR family transcriptional regulator n=1 Tax=Mesobacillus foraminis TaxID=279826 RepID=A0A4V2RCL5_9BACI|nr:GntR family transcriptional regulator [Mesobacillus foraminis]MBT2758831.1 GntR family transcriptional regulator [Mesobacillus foraminis]TCN21440.1 GntR family transcriptional regulator [Mesobacillus foraminis]